MNTKRLKELLEIKKMSPYMLACKAEIGQATAHDIVHGYRKDPKISTVKKIADVLNVKLEELY